MKPTEIPNPPAFPNPGTAWMGMALRDYLAVHALTGVIAAHTSDVACPAAKDAARMAYSYADAMLLARLSPPAGSSAAPEVPPLDGGKGGGP